jgi:hypothetical protein
MNGSTQIKTAAGRTPKPVPDDASIDRTINAVAIGTPTPPATIKARTRIEGRTVS